MPARVCLSVRMAVALCVAGVALRAGSVQSGVAVAASPNPSTFGQSVTLTATVSPSGASGTVTFYAGTSVLGTAVLNGGTATLKTILLPAGTSGIRAYYGGDTTYAPAASAAATQIVNARPATTFTPAAGSSINVGFAQDSIVVTDFNGDGKADVAIADGNTGVVVLLGNGRGGFLAANGSPLRAGPALTAVATGDFNTDGNVDLIAVNDLGDNLTVFLGDGTGAFTQATGSPVPAGSFPRFITVADFNGDGKADLALTNDQHQTVTVLLGNGLGGFTPAPTSPFLVGSDPVAITASDFNGDGNADLAVANNYDTTVVVLLGDGAGGFTRATGSPISLGGNPGTLLSADFNRDGHPDLAVTFQYGLRVLLGNGDGSFKITSEETLVTGTPVSTRVADFNGDGKPDIVLGDWSEGTVTLALGDGAGGFVIAAGSPFTIDSQRISSLAVADFNGDGRPDLAVASGFSSHLTISLGRGLLSSTNLVVSANPSAFGGPLSLTATINPSAAGGAITFYDGVTLLGTATINAGTAVLQVPNLAPGKHFVHAYYVGDATYAPSGSTTVMQMITASPSATLTPGQASVSTGRSPVGAAVSDFNGDGYLDIATVNNGSNDVTILLGDAAGNFAIGSGGPIAVGAGANSIITGDFNLDGAPDVAVASATDNNVSVLLGDHNGGFVSEPGSPFGVGISPQSLAVGDFDGDGRADLVVANAGGFNITTLLNTGSGGMTAVTGAAFLAAGPYSIAVADLNGDGIADLAVTTASNNSVSVLFGIGDGTFVQNSSSQHAVGVNPVNVIASDLNGDGKPDLAVANKGSNSVTVLLAGANGAFTPAGPFAVGRAPQAVTSGDFNADGRLDLFVANSEDNTVTVLLGDGNGGFTEASGSPFAAGTGPVSLATADFNRDGKTDLATANFSGDNVSLLLGAGPVSSTQLTVSTSTSLLGETVTLTAHVTPATTGLVEFYDGATPLGSAAVSGGLAVFRTSLLPWGRRELRAYYRGDATYPPSSSTVVTHVVRTAGSIGFVAGGANGLSFEFGSLSAAVADFNGDGKADLAIATSTDVKVFLGDGNGSFMEASSFSKGGQYGSAIHVLDFNGDGVLDVLLVSVNNNVALFTSNGRGGFTQAPNSPLAVGTEPRSVAIADFNGDGFADIAVANRVSGSVSIVLGNAAGKLAVANTVPASLQVDGVASADFNGDGIPDLAITDGASGTVTVWLGNGSGAFTAVPGLPLSVPYAGALEVGDVNGDGFADLAIPSFVTDRVIVAFGDGTGIFTLANTATVLVTRPTAVRISDIDGDGNADLLILNSDADTISIFLGDGHGSFTLMKPGAFAVGTEPDFAAVADFNGDGRADLLTANGLGTTPDGIGTNLSVLLGTVPTPLGFYPLTPCRVADTRDSGKSAAFGPPLLAGNTSRDFSIADSDCGVPSTAKAFSLNATVVPRAPLGYLSLWSSGQPFPIVSTLNSPDASVIANAAIVPAGRNGSITARVTNDTDLILDVNGYFGPSSSSELVFYPVTPCRVADTRVNSKGPLFGPPALAGGALRDFPIPQSSCGIPSTAQAYALNFTVVPQGPLGYLSAWPAGEPFPTVSTLNSLRGSVIANAAIVPAGDNGAIRVLATNPTDLIIDVNGYFAPPRPGGLHFYTVPPCRVADTRANGGALAPPSERQIGIAASNCGVPASAQAYSLNITAVPVGPLGYLSIWPAGKQFPIVSTLNSYNGLVVANAAIVPAGTNGAISIFASDVTYVVVDINGYFAP